MTREEKIRKSRDLEARTVQFAVRTFRLLDALPQCASTRVIAFQLGKSASSVGANYHEANRAESRDDFVHKMNIALKECAESCYWFDILAELRPSSENVRAVREECRQLRAIFQSSVGTTRARVRSLEFVKS